MKKKLSLFGIVIGALVAIIGVLISFGATGNPYSGVSYWDHTSTVSVIINLYILLRECCGFFMIGFGLLSCCGFGIVYAGCITILKGEVGAKEDIEVSEENSEGNIDIGEMPVKTPIGEISLILRNYVLNRRKMLK